MAGENKEAAIVDAVAALLLAVSGQVRASTPETSEKLLAMRDELTKDSAAPPAPNTSGRQPDPVPPVTQ